MNTSTDTCSCRRICWKRSRPIILIALKERWSFCGKRNGGAWASLRYVANAIKQPPQKSPWQLTKRVRVWDGNTTKYTSRSHISCFSSMELLFYPHHCSVYWPLIGVPLITNLLFLNNCLQFVPILYKSSRRFVLVETATSWSCIFASIIPGQYLLCLALRSVRDDPWIHRNSLYSW